MTTNRKNLSSIAGIAPCTEVFAITKHDTDEQPANRGFMVTGAGNVVIRAIGSSADVTIAVLAGVRYDFAIRYMRSTNTTATGLIGYN